MVLFIYFFGYKVCGILVSQPGIKAAIPALEGKIFSTTGSSEKSPYSYLQ